LETHLADDFVGDTQAAGWGDGRDAEEATRKREQNEQSGESSAVKSSFRASDSKNKSREPGSSFRLAKRNLKLKSLAPTAQSQLEVPFCEKKTDLTGPEVGTSTWLSF
jgi:hypothetical protein